MPNQRSDEKFRRLISQGHRIDAADDARAPSRLKARVYSALVREQQASSPLPSLSATQAAGRGLCIFEKLVQIAPIGEAAKTPFFCACCHARLLAENMERAPIRWAHCPYADFQK